jgi:hypothetical protein
MIRIDLSGPGRYRVIGSLRGGSVSLLSEALARGPIVCDLAEVDQADDAAVRFLAGLPAERCTLVACPKWLGLWIERLREAPAQRC